MRKFHLLVAAAVIATLSLIDMQAPASAARTWSYWPNSGYCPPGTCTPGGYWRAANVRRCRPRPNCLH